MIGLLQYTLRINVHLLRKLQFRYIIINGKGSESLNLKDTFTELYSEKNIEQISIKDITNHAGMNRGTFYIYFCDIYQLLAANEDELVLELTYRRKDKSSQLSRDEIIEDTATHFSHFIRKRERYFRTLLLGNNNLSFAEKLKLHLKQRMFLSIRFEKINQYVIDIGRRELSACSLTG